MQLTEEVRNLKILYSRTVLTLTLDRSCQEKKTDEGWIVNVNAFEPGDPVYKILEKL